MNIILNILTSIALTASLSAVTPSVIDEKLSDPSPLSQEEINGYMELLSEHSDILAEWGVPMEIDLENWSPPDETERPENPTKSLESYEEIATLTSSEAYGTDSADIGGSPQLLQLSEDDLARIPRDENGAIDLNALSESEMSEILEKAFVEQQPQKTPWWHTVLAAVGTTIIGFLAIAVLVKPKKIINH